MERKNDSQEILSLVNIALSFLSLFLFLHLDANRNRSHYRKIVVYISKFMHGSKV